MQIILIEQSCDTQNHDAKENSQQIVVDVKVARMLQNVFNLYTKVQGNKGEEEQNCGYNG